MFSGSRRKSEEIIPKILVLGKKLWTVDVQYFWGKQLKEDGLANMTIPLIFNKPMLKGQSTTHVCEKNICQLPTSNFEKSELTKILSDAKINPLYHPSSVLVVDEIPKLGSGKTDFGATKKIALVNDQ